MKCTASLLDTERPQGRKNTYRALHNLHNFINFCNKNYEDKHLTLQMVNTWCKKRKTENASSYNKRTSLIRTFLYYLKEQGHLNIKISQIPQYLSEGKPGPDFSGSIFCRGKDAPGGTCDVQTPGLSRPELFDKYIGYRKASGLKVSKSALNNLTAFANFCNDKFKDNNCLTEEMTEKWCAKRENELPSSRNARISLVCRFLDFLRKRHFVDIENPQCIPNERKLRRIPHEFTEEELCNFFKACDNIPSKYKIRKYERIRRMVVPVIFRLLYSSGMRTCEARELRRRDVDLGTGVVNIVISKTYSEHLVVLHDSMRELLIRYDAAMENAMPGRSTFFPNIDDKPFSNHWLNDNFNQMWYCYNNSHAIPYDFRHGYAIKNINSWMKKQGTDNFVSGLLLALSRSMGHDSIGNTLYYYSFVPSFGKILEDFCGESYNNVVQELNYDEEYE